jgi:S1-C subfamily serine protease
MGGVKMKDKSFGLRSTVLAGVAAATLAALLVGPFGSGAALANASSERSSAVRGAPLPASIDTAAVAKAVEPSVVDINTVLDALEGGGATAGAGTGMIVSPDGLVVTNNHVVQGADKISVVIPGHGTRVATFVGSDPSADIALLKVTGLTKLPTVHWGSSSGVQVGLPVVAIGNALGLGGQPTVTEGIISATNRTITAADETGSNQETLHGLLQTDAPIAPGNSGGPLVNAKDQVIGMDTAAASAGTVGASIGFAIPSNTVRTIAGELEAHKDLPGFVYGREPFLGVEVIDSSQAGSFGFGLPFGFPFGFGLGPLTTTPNGTPGVIVAAVDPGSPAANAGIQGGYVITAIDGKATPSTTALSKVVLSHKPGQVVKLSVSTPNGNQTVSVRLADGPVD